MSQLILSLDDDLLQAAQAYAHQHGQALDVLVAELLKAAVQPAQSAVVEAATSRPLSARIQALYGALKVPADFDYKKELEDGLAEKYGV